MASQTSTTPALVGRRERPGGLIAERAYRELRDRIVTLQLPPGAALREDELMRELGIGRTPLREAVQRLTLENLVSVQPRRRTLVTDVRVDDIVQITEVRAELEGYAAHVAASVMDPDAVAEAEALLSQIDALGGEGQDALMRFDERIHRFTWDAARNPYLAETLEQYFALSLRVWYLVLDRVPALGASVHDQANLLRALVAGDAVRARGIMRDHVLAFQRDVRTALAD
jgi:DNA-binding GntR family transcriptional regulator